MTPHPTNQPESVPPSLAKLCYDADNATDDLFKEINIILGCKWPEEMAILDCWVDGYDSSVEIVFPEQGEWMTREQADAVLALGFGMIYESHNGTEKCAAWFHRARLAPRMDNYSSARLSRDYGEEWTRQRFAKLQAALAAAQELLASQAGALRIEVEKCDFWNREADRYATECGELRDANADLRARLEAAERERDSLTMTLRTYPAKWTEDSSLETWFPCTAKELRAAQAQESALRAALENAIQYLHDLGSYPGSPRERLIKSLEAALATPSPKVGGDDSRRLVWSKEPPKVEGWYWRRPTPRMFPHALWMDEDKCKRAQAYLDAWPECQWAGPIPEPSAAMTATAQEDGR